ncbi:tyrosine-type recombinase/integrase [Sulfurimonas sp.]|uniref:tyrosine-type recombinase/integrase n=1 Tax=Sulfurimonas sp. TaxID=2022749 RepID=UPI0025EDEDED|nr:tyrosine-type recombinase/integrase [Sulfurimonas sp.]MCK9454106.1 tyrosine-type recombinase/integrase [Sulfurimonas sp.]
MSNELEAFIEYISVIKALSKKSVEAYRSDLRGIEELLGRPLVKMDSALLFSALGMYKNRRTLNRKLSAINAFFDFCYSSQFSTQKRKFKLSKIPKLLPKFLSYAEIQNGLSMIDRSTLLGLRDYAFVLFLYATGARVSEALALCKEDIEGEWLHIRHAKGDKERIIPIAKVAVDALESYLREKKKEDEFIWSNYKGGRLSRISAYKITQKYIGVSPHVLRHSYATSLISGGADLRVVQELLGHASLLTTQVYTHIQKQDLKETVEVCHPMASESL